MTNEILDYIGLDIDNISENIKNTKPSYEISKSIDNSNSYKIYKKINPKDVSILIGNDDRTTDIKERYNSSITLGEYIEKFKDDFIGLAEKTSIEKIQELEKIQESFKEKLPYFVKYDKNYLWQIYYSRADKKYFMLFPAKEGETEVLFYMIKMQCSKENSEIYVPICQESYNEEVFKNTKQIDELENYIWSFTKEWPKTYEISIDDKTSLYIIGKTNLINNLETKYRTIINNQEELENEYTLFKALFILSTETNYLYKFEPQINKNGKLILTYNNKEINIENLQEFITSETAKQQNDKYRLKSVIENDKDTLKSIREIIDKQNLVYTKQEKQIVTYMNCRKSFFKKVRYFFTSNKKFNIDNKKIMNSLKAQIVLATGNIKEEEPDQTSENILENSSIFTLSDLIKIAKETKNILNESKNVKADIKAAKLKQRNMEKKIENANSYLEEIEKHKKSIFEFWRFTNKDNVKSLEEGNSEEKEVKKEKEFNYEEDYQNFCEAIDELQRKKLSNDECDSIYVSKDLLVAINSIITKSNSYAIEEEYEKVKDKFKPESMSKKILGEMQDDYTEIKVLNNHKHRENKRDLFSILKFNETTTLEDFREKIREVSNLLNEAYNKITSPYSVPIYYSKKNKGYIIGDIDPYKIVKEEDTDKLYWINASNDIHSVFFSNIVFYTNYNNTLPLGMDESTKVILKVGENKKVDEKEIKILLEDDEFNATIKKIKVIHEEKATFNKE